MSSRRPLLDPARRRLVPGSFSWIDRRFFREGYADRLSRDAVLLYLFLCGVADRDGLSWYSDPTLCRLLGIEDVALPLARRRLLEVGLIAHRTPIYQVLSLDPPPDPAGLGTLVREIARRKKVD